MRRISSNFSLPRPKTLIFLPQNPSSYLIFNYHSFSLSLLEIRTRSDRFHQILAHAITSGNFSDPFVSSKLLYRSLSNPDTALDFSRSLFFQIRDPNVFAWNFMFRAYSQSSLPEEAIHLYNQMRRRSSLPDKYSFPFLLKACGRVSGLKKGLEIHCSSVKLGLESDVFVQNALISMYFQCGLSEHAQRVFDKVPSSVRDVVTWNSLISGLLQSELCNEALRVFGGLLGNGNVMPNEVTLVTALAACAGIGLLDLGRKIHGFSVVHGYVVDAYLGSSLVDMYTKCGCLEHARKVFNIIFERNIVCWTSIIAGYVQSGLFKEALELFREVQVSGIKADSATIACVISACGHSGALDQGRWVHAYCERNEIEMNLTVNNALVDMYSKCGEIYKALEIFHSISHRDVFSWSAMISGLAMNGEADKALYMFLQMETSSDIRPNEVTFLGVLSACSHGGFVDQGFHYFEAMTLRYNLTPHLEHYGCMVDLLGRANLLLEAEKFIRSMPIQPDVVIWRSLLFACRNSGNMKLAEFAASKIWELEPARCGARVLLSNVYASAARWSDAKRVRKDMTNQGIRKQPGCSFIEINGLVHEFFVADNSHEGIDFICETVWEIDKVIKSEAFDQIFDKQEQ